MIYKETINILNKTKSVCWGKNEYLPSGWEGGERERERERERETERRKRERMEFKRCVLTLNEGLEEKIMLKGICDSVC